MTLVRGAGVFLAVERGDRDVVALLKAEREARRVLAADGDVILTSDGVAI